MLRVALYGRYSDASQNASSVDDQHSICREYAAREGWEVVAVYGDKAISGSGMLARPGIQALLRDVKTRKFDIVLAEALDRMSRDQADVATMFKKLNFENVQLFTLSEQRVTELHIGLKGTMNALFLKDLSLKTHRGVEKAVEKGQSGGGLCYGYKVVHSLDSNGLAVHGGRAIIESEAEVIRGVFRDFAAGISPLAIAKGLNDRRLKGPEGGSWSNSSIRGNTSRGTGLINNEAYIGKLVWNRLSYVINPETEKRASRLNPESEWTVRDVPSWRIVSDELWQAAKARQQMLTEIHQKAIEGGKTARANRLNDLHRPVSLLSRLVACSTCGGPYALRGQDRFACSNHTDKRTCTNSRTIDRYALETRVLAGLRERLMAPEIAAAAMRAYAEETNRLNRERRSSGDGDRRNLAKVQRSIKEIIAAIEDGDGSRSLRARLVELESREDDITARLAQAPLDMPDILPNVSGLYARKVERLAKALEIPEERAEAATAIRSLIERIVITPGEKRGQIDVAIEGELGTILAWSAQKTNSPGANASGVSVSVASRTRNHHDLRQIGDRLFRAAA